MNRNNQNRRYSNKIILTICNLFISIVSAYILSATFLDRIINDYTEEIYIFILVRVWIAIMIYIFIDGVLFKNGFSIIRKNVFLLSYLGFIMILIFKPTKYRGYNFNILAIINDLKLANVSMKLLIGNIIVFIVLGIVVKAIFQKNDRYLMLIFIGSIFVVEVIQYTFMLGVFDMNDILLNSFGFFIGIRCERYLLETRIDDNYKTFFRFKKKH